MPRCSICRKSVPGTDLGPVPGQVTDKGPVLACNDCRGLKAVPPVQEVVPTLQAEKTMSEKDKSSDPKVASLNIYDIGGDDYRLDLNVRIGGVSIEVSKSVSEVRDFFTKRKDQRPGRGLKAVPKEE